MPAHFGLLDRAVRNGTLSTHMAHSSSIRWNVLNLFIALILTSSLCQGEVVINEFLAGNVNGLKDEQGEYQDWIELHNNGADAVDLSGWSLTDDRGKPEKWIFPSRSLKPGQYLVVFASGKNKGATGSARMHTNFRLNLSGEYLALFKPGNPRVSTTEISPKFPEQRNNYSYGLDSSFRWRYFKNPTPEKSNGESSIQGITPAPAFSVERGIYNAPFTVKLSPSLDGATVRYSTDGSDPASATAKLYSSPLQITNTVVIRAFAFKDGYLPSQAQTHSYIFLDQLIHQSNKPAGFPTDWGSSPGFPGRRVPADYEMDSDPLRVDPNNPSSPIDPAKFERFRSGLRELPLVSLVLKMADMFGDEGLYPNAREDSAKDSNEKPCSVEMILPNGKSAFAATCGIDLHGNASRNPMKNPKHGFKLAFKAQFGDGQLDYKLFPDSPAKSFDDLILRPDFGVSWLHWTDSGRVPWGTSQRTRATRIRDAWFKNTFRDMGHIASHNRYCHLFINGLYWGVYDFTEQPTDSFARNYFGGEKSEFDVFDQGVLRSGTSDAYESMIRLANSAPSAYERFAQMLDLPQFVDYMLLHFFVGHQDWGYSKNWYAIRKRAAGPEGVFRYFPWDGENLLLDEDIDRVTHPDVPSGLHNKLILSPEYRLAFADRVHKQLIAPGGALTSDSNIARWQKWQAIVDKPIVAESVRWGDYRRDVHRFADGRFVLYTRESHWIPENDRMVKSYFVHRNATVLKQLRAAALYPLIDPPTFQQQNTDSGITLTMTVSRGTIYYTTNGVDPRIAITGAVSPVAATYEGNPVSVAANGHVKARTLTGRSWSALNELVLKSSQK
jgi:hypothetical protein